MGRAENLYPELPNQAGVAPYVPPPTPQHQPKYQQAPTGPAYTQVQQHQPHVITTSSIGVVKKDRRDGCDWFGNILWIVLGGGLVSAIVWGLVGVVLCISIIGIPFGLQCFKLMKLSFLPFGKTIFTRDRSCCDCGTGHGCLHILGNIVWLPFGIVLALVHIIFGILCCITIIGIPFGIQHFKLANLSLWPFGADSTASEYEPVRVTTSHVV
eukprot:TRINITY_DN5127_c0_g1_i1.p1 TRINITY_DN5127_c0_g1~~TRINITY_DN5127_c0_g1_i1.p1  ORF type:complete len:212 (+),score=45.92 TRINITY_DN5127_c0_g1_i1:101-736(+)